MQKLLLTILLLFVFCISFSRQKSVHTIEELTHAIRAIVQEQNIPGLMVGITTRDSILFSGGFGYADISAKRLVNSQTLFRMGSVTKMFISLTVLKLVQEGKLSLDDAVKKIAPEVPVQNQWEATQPVRVVHLLEHTAGFDDMKLNRMCSQDTLEYIGKEMMLLQKNSYRCRWKPGERYAYSNPGYVILGYIIGKITGKSWDQYITENILNQLGMSATNFNLFSRIAGKDTKQYVVHNRNIKEVPSVTVLMGPAGALWSCADDMVKFLRLFLNDGHPLFPGNVINEMETAHSTLAARAGLKSGYALGNADMLFYNKYRWQGHRGLMGTCYSTLAYNRELGVGFVLSSNGNQPNRQLENIIAGYLEQNYPGSKPDTNATDVAAITPFLGQYQFESPRNGIAAFKDRFLNTPQIILENNTLYLKSFWNGEIKLIQTEPLKFIKEGANTATVIFTKNNEGKNVMIIDSAYFEQTSFARVAVTFWISMMAIFFAITSVIAGLISLIGYIAGRVTLQQFPVRILPMIAVALLVWAVLQLLQVEKESYLLSELTGINARTIIVFFGTLLFGIISLLHLGLVIARFRKMKNYWFASYWLITAVSLCFLSFVLLQNGWIGLRTWAM